jgi:hypothetical protein
MSLLVQALAVGVGLVPEHRPGETVERPEPGLARGRWEGPAWVFYVIAAAAILGGLSWAVLAWRARLR